MSIKEYFDSRAITFEAGKLSGRINYPGCRYFQRKLERLIRPFIKKDARVLEFGAGTGAYTYIFNTDVSLDFSYNMLLQSRKRNHSHFVVADAQDMPFKENSFDLAVGINAFSYFPDKCKSLGEIGRILKENGRIIICDMNGGSPLWSFPKPAAQKEALRYLPESNRLFLHYLFRKHKLKILTFREISWIPFWANNLMVVILRPIEAILTIIPVLKHFALRLLIIGEKEAR